MLLLMQLKKRLNPYYVGRCSMRFKSPNGEVLSTLNGLNPYYVGRCSMRLKRWLFIHLLSSCLNPYYVGRCSMSTPFGKNSNNFPRVLILIMLEDAL